MKRRFYLATLSLVSALSHAACNSSRSDDGRPNPTSNNGETPGNTSGGDSTPLDPTPTPGSPGLNEGTPLFKESEATKAQGGRFFAHAQWLDGPHTSVSRVRLTFADAQLHKPTESVDLIAVVPFMPSMGHGQGDEGTHFVPVGGGKIHQFDVGNILMFMTGQWELRIQAKVNGVEDSARIPVEVP